MLRPPQVLVQGMLDAWGPDGLERHTRTMQKAYAHRAQVLLAAAGVDPSACSVPRQSEDAEPVLHQRVLAMVVVSIIIDSNRVPCCTCDHVGLDEVSCLDNVYFSACSQSTHS